MEAMLDGICKFLRTAGHVALSKSGRVAQVIAISNALLVLVPEVPARAMSYPPAILTEGLALKDEFDSIVSSALSCPTESWKRYIADLNRREGMQVLPPDCHPAEQALTRLLERVRQEGSDLRNYLESRRGTCTALNDGVQCRIVRDVVQHSHTGDRAKADVFRDIFTVDVLLTPEGKPSRVTLTRDGVGR